MMQRHWFFENPVFRIAKVEDFFCAVKRGTRQKTGLKPPGRNT
jgi:hypothetical protein